jgi:hypothetical protein
MHVHLRCTGVRNVLLVPANHGVSCSLIHHALPQSTSFSETDYAPLIMQLASMNSVATKTYHALLQNLMTTLNSFSRDRTDSRSSCTEHSERELPVREFGQGFVWNFEQGTSCLAP